MRQTSAETAKAANTPSDSQTDLARADAVEISGTLRLLLADVFVLYVKTKQLSLAYDRQPFP
jgi:DNA-binding ferritin-like protein